MRGKASPSLSEIIMRMRWLARESGGLWTKQEECEGQASCHLVFFGGNSENKKPLEVISGQAGAIHFSPACVCCLAASQGCY